MDKALMNQQQATVKPQQATKRSRPVRIIKMLLLAFVLTWLLGYWIQQSEIVALACQITEAVPPIPAVATLLLLLALNPLIRRLPHLRELSGGEITVVYIFVTVATNMFGCSIVRFLLASVSAGYYYSTPEYPMAKLASNLPAWLSPTNPLVHKAMYEGSPSGLVPWNAWATPMLAWTGLFLLLGCTLLGLMILVSDRWIEHERLSFPLVRLPLEMMGRGTSGSFFRNPATWIGFGLAAVLNLYNSMNAVFRGGPSGGLRFDFGRGTEDFPWAAVLPFSLHIRPELIGLGYLVSTDIAFAIWFSWLLHRLQALVMVFAGYRVDQMPFTREQGIGAYFILGVILLWKDRRVITEALRSLFGAGEQQDRSYQWGLLATVGGALGTLFFLTSAGLESWLAILYLGIILLVAVVYARARAETGVPLNWLYPFGEQQKVIYNFLGTAPIIGHGGALVSPTIFAVANLFSRGYFPTVAGYEIEGLRLGRETGVGWRQVAITIMLAMAWGTVAGFIFHLRPYYARGAISLRGGIWGYRDAQSSLKWVLNSASSPQPPDPTRITATLFGAGFVVLLTVIRNYWFGFPLHPIGYAVACAYGSLVWGAFFLVWLIKSLILHYGGGRAYQKALPAFLGFALGHFITAGVIWGALSAFLGGPFLRWGVWFG